MIVLTRHSGTQVAVNADLIQYLESADGTVVTLVDGTLVEVQEPVDEVIEAITAFRASILVAAGPIEAGRLRQKANIVPLRKQAPLYALKNITP